MDAIRSVWDYVKFFQFPLLLGLSIPLFIIGGSGLLIYTLLLGAYVIVGDLFFGEDTRHYEGTWRHPNLLIWMEILSQPLMAAVVILFAWMLGLPNGIDLFGIGAAVQSLTGFDPVAAHAAHDHIGTLLGGLGLAAGAGAIAGVVIGHNLGHRTYDLKSVVAARIGSAFGMFSYFTIRHPYGHHNLVGTPADPSWARRGESFWRFRLRSVIGQYRMTWALEKQRLGKLGEPLWSWRNGALQGWGIEVLIAAMFFHAAGAWGLLAFLAIGILAHTGLEAANYIEHQGLVRLPTQPFQPRHAWDDAHRMTYWLVSAISRHSHHHSDAQVEEYELQPMAHMGRAMTTPWGYLGSGFVALFPAWWNRVITPRLLEWDEKFATPAERELAARENLRSGIPELIIAGRRYYEEQGRPVPFIRPGDALDGYLPPDAPAGLVTAHT